MIEHCTSTSVPYLSFVVPCCNEQAGLVELHRRLDAAARQIMKPFEIILVDDGSTDGTRGVMLHLASAHPEVVAVSLSRNFGQQAALSAGLAVSAGEHVVTLDADLQDPPELLPQLLEQMDQGADVVHARRRSRTGESWFKRATAAAFYRLLARQSDTPIQPDSGEFRLLTRRVVDELLRMPERHRLLRGMTGWLGFRHAAVEYDRPPRAHGTTKFPLRKMVRLAMDAGTSFSTGPLRFATWLGLACGGLAVLAIAGAGWSFLRSGAVSAWLPVLAISAAFSSLQLLALGIVGEYLGRLYEQSQGRPLFVIDEIRRGRTSNAGDDESRGLAAGLAAAESRSANGR
ncbi:MAG: glycosyltransferase family 2 protein [Pirellulales bacterium]